MDYYTTASEEHSNSQDVEESLSRRTSGSAVAEYATAKLTVPRIKEARELELA